jgi:hypothetical protein
LLRSGINLERFRSSVGATLFRRLTFSLSVVVLAVGCREILGDFQVRGRDASVEPSDGGRDATDAKATNVANPPDAACVGATYPGPPTVAGSGGDITFNVSLVTEDWGDLTLPDGGPSNVTLGRNLDGLCSGATSTACSQPASAMTDFHADGPSGIDNAAGQAAAYFGGGITALDQQSERLGTRAYVVRVSGYNGEMNDDNVTVAWYAATAHRVSDAGVDEGDAGAAPANPRVWHPLNDYTSDSLDVAPRYETRLAYVTNGTLVASFLQLAVGGPPSVSKLSKATVTATVELGDAGSYVLHDVLLTGRWAVGDVLNLMLTALARFDNANCADAPQVQPKLAYLTQYICNRVDVSSAGDDLSNTCDSLSLGVKFGSMPAELSGPVVTTKDKGNCSTVTAELCKQFPVMSSRATNASSP